MILSELAPLVSAQHAVSTFAPASTDSGDPFSDLPGRLRIQGAQARREPIPSRRRPFVGQCAQEKGAFCYRVSPGDYVGSARAWAIRRAEHFIALPILFEGSVRGPS